MKYRVELSAKATVTTTVEVEAAIASEARAKAREQAQAGDVIWKYDGAEDDTIQVEFAYPVTETRKERNQ
jgi:hypothetical protein